MQCLLLFRVWLATADDVIDAGSLIGWNHCVTSQRTPDRTPTPHHRIIKNPFRKLKYG